jgi:hypothetical protein
VQASSETACIRQKAIILDREPGIASDVPGLRSVLSGAGVDADAFILGGLIAGQHRYTYGKKELQVLGRLANGRQPTFVSSALLADLANSSEIRRRTSEWSRRLPARR